MNRRSWIHSVSADSLQSGFGQFDQYTLSTLNTQLLTVLLGIYQTIAYVMNYNYIKHVKFVE